jgi:hypothetical protein
MQPVPANRPSRKRTSKKKSALSQFGVPRKTFIPATVSCKWRVDRHLNVFNVAVTHNA